MTSRESSVDDAVRRLGRRLSIQRRTAGLTQVEFASLTGYSRSTVAGVETGRQHVDVGFWQRCDEVLSARGELIEAHAGLERLRERRRRDLSQAARLLRTRPWAGTQHVGALGGVASDEPPLGPILGGVLVRQQLDGAAGAEHRTSLIVSAADRARRFTSSMELTNVGGTDLEQLADDVRYLAVSYQQIPLNILLEDIVAAQAHVFELLEGHQRPAQ